MLKRRRAAADGIAAAAQAGGQGGTVLHQLPEFLLPYLIQVSPQLLGLCAVCMNEPRPHCGVSTGQGICCLWPTRAAVSACMSHPLRSAAAGSLRGCACANAEDARWLGKSNMQSLASTEVSCAMCRSWRTIQTSLPGRMLRRWALRCTNPSQRCCSLPWSRCSWQPLGRTTQIPQVTHCSPDR